MTTIQFYRRPLKCLRAMLTISLLFMCARLALADSTYPEARIDLVSFNKIETRTFSCRDGSSTCVTTVGTMTEERWSQQLKKFLRERDFLAPNIDASFFRSYRTAASARYDNRICTETSDYKQVSTTSLQRPGSRTYECTQNSSAPTRETSELTSPPTLHIEQENGSFSRRWLISDRIIEDYSINLSSRMELTFNGPPLKMYQAALKVSATRVDLDPNTHLFNYTPVPCRSITVAGRVADSSCTVKVIIPAGTDPNLPNIQVLDVTPSVSGATYFSYDVSLLGVPQEK